MRPLKSLLPTHLPARLKWPEERQPTDFFTNEKVYAHLDEKLFYGFQQGSSPTTLSTVFLPSILFLSFRINPSFCLLVLNHILPARFRLTIVTLERGKDMWMKTKKMKNSEISLFNFSESFFLLSRSECLFRKKKLKTWKVKGDWNLLK